MDEGSKGYYSADVWFIITGMLALALPRLALLLQMILKLLLKMIY